MLMVVVLVSGFQPGMARAEDAWYDDFKVKLWGELWAVPLLEADDPLWRHHDPFFLRFARASVTYSPNAAFEAKTVLGLENGENPLLDFVLRYKGNPWLNVTGGQFKIPVSRSIMDKASELTFLDRPMYVQSMSKSTLRDLGVMVHTDPGGVLGGVLSLAVGVFNGNGRFGVATLEGDMGPEDLLYIGRAVVDFGPLFLGHGGHLELGVSYAAGNDPGIDTGDAAADRLASTHYLGATLTPYAVDRFTQLLEGDFNFELRGFLLSGEVQWLASAALDESVAIEALGGHVDVAYRFNELGLQPALRFEVWDPNRDAVENLIYGGELGLNYDIWRARISIFGGFSRYEVPDEAARTVGRLALGAQLGF